jgi:hypothetical protein
MGRWRRAGRGLGMGVGDGLSLGASRGGLSLDFWLPHCERRKFLSLDQLPWDMETPSFASSHFSDGHMEASGAVLPRAFAPAVPSARHALPPLFQITPSERSSLTTSSKLNPRPESLL